MPRLNGHQPKGWGHELIWATNDLYCGKLLNFHDQARCSMHFHHSKDETWYILSGQFLVRYIDTQDSAVYSQELKPGDTWHNPPLQPHQLICLTAGTIIEVSTPDSVEDNYRIIPGDSQRVNEGQT